MKYFRILIGIVLCMLFVAVARSQVRASVSKIIGWEIKGVAYNPVAIGTTSLDPLAPAADIAQIAALGANTVSTYNLGKFEWGGTSNATVGETFYAALYPEIERYNLKLIVGYFSNASIDWTDSARVATVTSQYQQLVQTAKNRPSTLMYLIGNEVFEQLPNDAQKMAYAKWIGAMTDWTHTNDPAHPVSYADNARFEALNWLKVYAANLDIYSINNYEWESAADLTAVLLSASTSWPGKSLLLHEWGTDSLNAITLREDVASQADKISQLARDISSVYNSSQSPFLGGVLFEYSDQWDKIGSISSQDMDSGWPWACNTCFEGRANEDYWGITRAVYPGQAANRTKKSSYVSLQQAWNGAQPGDTTMPQVSITSPANNSVFSAKTKVSLSAQATDNMMVTHVIFLVNGSQICMDSSAPYTCVWSTPKKPGTFSLSANAIDAAGNTGTATISVATR